MPDPPTHLEVLGSGQSSVAGEAWFLIGRPPTDAFLVVRDFDVPVGELPRHLFYRYFPGSAWQKLSEVDGATAELLMGFVANRKATGRLSWNDQRVARDLFWEFRTRHADAS